MSFCTFSKEAITSGKTSIDNVFITNYLPEATESAVKVYLYGLYLCQNSNFEDVNSFAETLNVSVDVVKDSFKFWEDYGIVSVISEDPFSVKYYPLNESGLKYKKFKPEKYADFTKALQLLVTDRMIPISEYNEYFNVLESSTIKPEALLMIVKYCIDLKGGNIGTKYIITVVKDFISRGITTSQLVERELSDYTLTSKELYEVLQALKINKKIEVEDQQLYKKWTENFGFDKEIIIFTAKNQKVKNFKKLDSLIEELYSNKRFTVEEVKSYFTSKEQLINLTVAINKNLGIYVEIVDTVIKNYISPWMAKGYNEETLIFISNYCFRKNKRSLEQMNDTISTLYKMGLVTLSSITSYITERSANDKFITKILENTGVNRKPNNWDRENLSTWRSWNFTDEMIIEASKRSTNSTNPMAYINGILSDWKSKDIFTIDKIPVIVKQTNTTKNSKRVSFANERNYTEDELNSIIDSIDDIKV